MPCPVCLGLDTDEVIRVHSIAAVAEHFIPEARSRERNRQLIAVLRRLWNEAESVEIHRCQECGFGFPIPYVAGDIEFYNLAYGNDPHYPRDRWEFRQTLACLKSLERQTPMTLLEAGAGEGWFLEGLRSSNLGGQFRVSALEYEQAAISKLRHRGFDARVGSLTELTSEDRFDVVCMFQTLEHMADVANSFRALYKALNPGGHAFISVPSAASINQQEETVGLWDMPPNHVGRWTTQALKIAAHRHGFTLRSLMIEPLSPLSELVRLGVYQVNSRAYRVGTWTHRINAIRSRPIRGLLKGLTATIYIPKLAWQIRPLLGHSMWVHLQRP